MTGLLLSLLLLLLHLSPANLARSNVWDLHVVSGQQDLGLVGNIRSEDSDSPLAARGILP